MLEKQLDAIKYPTDFVDELKRVFPCDKHLHQLADDNKFGLGKAIFDIILKEKPSLERRKNLLNFGSRWASLSCVMDVLAISLCS
jgi:hypothetical protein